MTQWGFGFATAAVAELGAEGLEFAGREEECRLLKNGADGT